MAPSCRWIVPLVGRNAPGRGFAAYTFGGMFKQFMSTYTPHDCGLVGKTEWPTKPRACVGVRLKSRSDAG